MDPTAAVPPSSGRKSPARRRWLVPFKVLALAAVTGLAASLPAAVRLATLGAAGPAAWVGSRCCMLWSRAALAIVGVRARVRNRPGGGPFLVAANHLSYVDIWLLGALYPSAFVAKREIASWPVFGWIARCAGTLFVNRDSPRDLLRASREMRAHLERGLPLTLFAEGKATSGETVLPFMPSLFESAARAQAPCYAATLSYDTPGSDPAPSDTVCWWGGTSFAPHLLRLLALPRIEATLAFSPSPVRSADRKELARLLHREVLASFVPVRQARPAPATSYSAGGSHSSAPNRSQGSRPSSESCDLAEK